MTLIPLDVYFQLVSFFTWMTNFFSVYYSISLLKIIFFSLYVWTTFVFAFISDKYIHWILNSELSIFSLKFLKIFLHCSHFSNDNSAFFLSFVCTHISFPLAAFKNFPFVSGFKQLYYEVCWCVSLYFFSCLKLI